MSLLAKHRAKQAAAKVEIAENKDVLGGAKGPLKSDAYKMKVESAFIKEAASGAMGIVMEFSGEDGIKFRNTQYATSGTKKGGNHYWTDKDGVNHELPGFTVVNEICKYTTGKGLFDLEEENVVIPLYNFEQRAELPTEVPMLTDLIGMEVVLGIQEIIENKSVKGNNGYVKTAETRKINEVNKVFNEDGFTATELKAGLEEPVFINAWLDKNKDVLIDKVDKNITAAAPVAGGAPTAAPKKSGIFGKK